MDNFMPQIGVPILDRFRAAYTSLEREVLQASRLHLGDLRRLEVTQGRVLSLQQATEQHAAIFDATEYATLRENFSQMTTALDEARHASADPPDGEDIVVVQRTRQGGRGRPRVEIDANILRFAMELRPNTALATLFGCSPRTIRRRALEYNLAIPCPPMSSQIAHEDGTQTTEYTSFKPEMAALTDQELDQITGEILETFPSFGRQMIIAQFRLYGYRVSRKRIRESYIRVLGPPPTFGGRRIERRVYKVAGPNALCHHDGWHGLIKFCMVVHLFIDGFSRFIKAVGVHDNNRADTVLQLFLHGVEETGLPSRCRGDHGGENMAVANYMEEQRGTDRNSYIWGRSVHNIRCERCWYDLNQGFGLKWKNFFQDLELFDGLVPTLVAHIWLVHHLFLGAIQADAELWRQVWNTHKMQLKGERDQSPREMFFFGTITNGPRGLYAATEPEDEVIDDSPAYGVDWDEYSDESLMANFLTANPGDHEDVFIQNRPQTLSVVEVVPPGCPLTIVEISHLNRLLEQRVNLSSESMVTRRVVWVAALQLCIDILKGREASES